MKLQISIRRLFLGAVFVALPFSTFGQFGPQGIMVSLVIAIPMFVACVVASPIQLRSMLGIILYTFIGFFIGELFPTVGRRSDLVNHLVFSAMVGCFIGIARSEFIYSRARQAEGSKVITEPTNSDPS